MVEPKLFGNRLTLHPIIILLCLGFWGTLWGVEGMILSVPITSVFHTVMAYLGQLDSASSSTASEVHGAALAGTGCQGTPHYSALDSPETKSEGGGSGDDSDRQRRALGRSGGQGGQDGGVNPNPGEAAHPPRQRQHGSQRPAWRAAHTMARILEGRFPRYEVTDADLGEYYHGGAGDDDDLGAAGGCAVVGGDEEGDVEMGFVRGGVEGSGSRPGRTKTALEKAEAELKRLQVQWKDEHDVNNDDTGNDEDDDDDDDDDDGYADLEHATEDSGTPVAP